MTGQPLTEEEQAWWLRQAELLARQLVEYGFSQDQLGNCREQLDPVVLGRFANSFSLSAEEPEQAGPFPEERRKTENVVQ